MEGTADPTDQPQVMKDKTGWNKYRRGPVNKITTDSNVLTIEALSSSGDGICHLDGRAVFVPYTMPGDRVRVKLIQQKKNFARGQLLELVSPSEQRISPPCNYFGRCGGCQWQHIPYEQQIQAKHEHLKHVLTHIGKQDDPPIQSLVQAPDGYNYRNRIQGEIRDGKFFFRHKGSDQPINISHCAIADPAINKHLEHSDLKKGLQGRVEIAADNTAISVLRINDKQSTELGFRQVNTRVSELLSHHLKAVVDASQCKTIVDLYCGRGSWTIELAQDDDQRHCIGVDSSTDNISIARQASQAAGLTNIEFIHAKVESSLSTLPVSDSLCIIDPPRAGLHATARSTLCKQMPECIIYISCHPATLARDILELTSSNYALQSVLPLDMFPQTPHLECMAKLVRKPL